MKSKKKILPIDKYVNEALYNKKFGYYMKKNPFGKKGDFITAPNISILFSEMIAIWIISFWENLKCPKKINLIELGAGNGSMLKEIINTFEKFPHIKKSCKIFIYEKSIYLKNLQKKNLKKKNITWLKDLNKLPKNTNIFIGNEFFDALPIKQFIKKNNKWYERNVEFFESGKTRFLDILTNIKKLEKKIGFKISYQQKFIEFSPLANSYLKIISKKIRSSEGGLLIIDYGYFSENMKNTLQSVLNHRYNNILNNFGNADITYCVNFNLLKRIIDKLKLKTIGVTSQEKFLTNLGILKRAEMISINLPFSKKADIYYRLKRLIDKNFMGRLFKVMFISKKNINFRLGF